jgi:hypothetical protein
MRQQKNALQRHEMGGTKTGTYTLYAIPEKTATL